MKIIDLHCDALLKLWEDQSRSIKYLDHEKLEASYERLQNGNVKVQLFAIFLMPEIPSDLKFQYALEQVDLFHTEVLAKHKKMKKIEQWEDIGKLKDGEIGAVLTLEGADAFGNDIIKLRTLYQLGVRSIGLTWNNANLCADGAGEPRGGGLTKLGFEVVRLNNEHRVWTDVSHLSEASFWDVIHSADYPVATHSNSKSICDHRRNLTDKQAQALFNKNGFIGLVFNPPFITGSKHATIDDLLKHVEHFCTIGGKQHIAFGSDFDGIMSYVEGLEHSGKYQTLIEELLKRYSEEDVRGFAYENVLKCLPV